MALSNFDLFDPAFISNPYPHYAVWQHEHPIFFWDKWDMWFLSCYKDVHTLLRDKRLGRAILHKYSRGELGWPEEPEIYQPFNKYHSHALLELEPPDHTRLRALVHQAFTARQIESLDTFIESLTHKLLDHIEPQGAMEFIKEFATPIPVTVIAKLLGVPDEDLDLLLPWSHRIVAIFELNKTDETVIDAGKAVEEFSDYLHTLIEARRKNPQDDLLTHLVQAEEEGERLNEDELIATCILVLNAGHEATVNMFGNGLLAFMNHPDQLQKLRNQPELLPSAVEEIMRYDTPLHLFRRWVLEDFEYKGFEFKRGTELAMLYGAANRDPARFDHPHEFDITRQDNQHLAFGQGIHYCLGAPLARLELGIGLKLLFERFPNLKLKPGHQLEYHPTFVFHGLKQLPVTF